MDPPSPTDNTLSITESSLGNLELLPPEIILEFLLRVESLSDLSNWCRTSKKASVFCRDDGFWRAKYQKDYGDIPSLPNLPWKDRYKFIYSAQFSSPISAGANHYGVIDENGDLVMVGSNDQGQLGTRKSLTIPIAVLTFESKIISILTEGYHTIAITERGYTYYWGDVRYTGLDDNIGTVNTPTLFSLESKSLKLSTGGSSIGIINRKFEAMLLGPSIWQLFTNLHPNIMSVKPFIGIPFKVVEIAVNQSGFAVISTDGNLFVRGHVSHKNEYLKALTDMQLPEPIKQVSMGAYHIMALSIHGNVYIWGSNEYGELGLGDFSVEFSNDPIQLKSVPPISFISCGKETSSAITTDGKLYMWGGNGSERITKDEIIKQLPGAIPHLTHTIEPCEYMIPYPIQIEIGSPLKYISVGHSCTIAITEDRIVNYWGAEWGPKLDQNVIIVTKSVSTKNE